jgi:hypothetical protein
MKFELNLKNSLADNCIELEKSLDSFNISSGEIVIVLHNKRVENHFKSGKLNSQNLASELPNYLDFGLVIIIDKVNPSITVYNDIYGAYPLFIETQEDNFIIKNSFEFDQNKTLNELAIVQLLHFNHLLGSNTLNTDVEKISGGQKIIIDINGYSKQDFFIWKDFVNETKKSIKTDSQVLMQASINESLNSKSSPILTLTGGFDSRLLFALLLQQKKDFSTITWGAPNNNQSSRAKEIASEFNIQHKNIDLDNRFKSEVPRILEYIVKNGTENPFITDVPQFVYMCENLEKKCDLISGFMGSEIIRGPSYSSQVTLTKFATDISLATSKEEIKNLILEFNKDFPYISDTFIEKNIDQLVEDYSIYSKINVSQELKNENIFKYLFLEKYPKIFGPIILFHHQLEINLINPYMDFKFIMKTLNENRALSIMTPFENSALKNFMLYRFYSKEVKKIYPQLLHTKMDRGYKMSDLITLTGLMKLAPYQVYRKFKKKKNNQVKTVDSNDWYQNLISSELSIDKKIQDSILNSKYIHETITHLNSKSDLDKIKIQLIFGLSKKMKG